MKQPRITKETNHFTGKEAIHLSFDDEHHLREWTHQFRTEGFADGQKEGLAIFQDSARILVNNIFGKDLFK